MSESWRSEELNPKDTLKILVATDIHLGYNFNKKGEQESDDSFNTFEEILQYGVEHEVDFVLLGGNLFHDAKPSQSIMLKCIDLLKRYCLGSRELDIQFLSEPEVVFQHCARKTVNYEDPNFNVSMPIFSIHGNHDEPSFGVVGSMDLLSASGLINYFGKYTDLTHVGITPLAFKKGNTCVAVYGLGHINDKKLLRMLKDFKVDLLSSDMLDCFNLFILHQNRASHLEHGHISETKLPDFLDFIIWGHEHECRITPEFFSEREYFICQPGSSIATSLCEGEAKAKHVGLLSINGKKFKMKRLKLKTVRPFVFDNLILADEKIQNDHDVSLSESVFNYVDNYIENEIIPKASEQLSGHPKQPVVPLILLRIFHTKDEETFDTIRLAQKYCEEVANPFEMVVFRKDRSTGKRSSPSKFDNISDDCQNMADIFDYTEENHEWNKTAEGELKKYFNLEENKDLLTVVTVDGLNKALAQFINKGDTDAFKNLVSHQIKNIVSHLEASEVTESEESIKEGIKSYLEKRKEKAEEEDIEIQTLFADKPIKDDSRDNSSDEAERSDKILPQKGGGRGITARGRRAHNNSKKSGRNPRGIATKISSTKTKK
nr:double-strand break repair protein MRE11-like isoform X1 [Megalopta genalis]XP_033333878.1 double-strand break repair protein MRE11-like isoform X1 [Megalopta genalis]